MTVHTCRITHAINNDQNQIQRANNDYRKNSGNNENRSSQLESKSIEVESRDEELSEEPDNNSNKNINAVNQNNDIELPANNNIDVTNEKQAEGNGLKNQLVGYQMMKIQIQE